MQRSRIPGYISWTQLLFIQVMLISHLLWLVTYRKRVRRASSFFAAWTPASLSLIDGGTSIEPFAHTPTSCLRQCSGYMHASSSGNSHHKSGSFWKASGSPAFLHRCPNISSGQFRSYSCTPSSLQGRRRMLHHPIRPRPTQACRRLHFHSTMTLLRDLASRSRPPNIGPAGRATMDVDLFFHLPRRIDRANRFCW